MPADQIRARGGAVKVRTIKTGPNSYRHVYVVADPGPHGGRTITGEEHNKNRDKAPAYRIKPARPVRRKRSEHGKQR